MLPHCGVLSAMKITIRIYRTHDFDLMSLYQAGNIPLAQVMKKAIIAYYCGEHFRFTVERESIPDLKAMPLVVNLLLSISDYDAPGIEHWIAGLQKGYRNSCFKSIFRHYLDDPCMAFYREDGCITRPIEMAEKPVPFPKSSRKKREKQEHTTQEWLDAVADGSIDRKQKGRKPRDLDEIFEKTQSINEQTAGEAEEQTAGQPLPVLSQKALEPTAQFISGHVQETDKDIVNTNADGEDEDVDFDDFEAFESIMG